MCKGTEARGKVVLDRQVECLDKAGASWDNRATEGPGNGWRGKQVYF